MSDIELICDLFELLPRWGAFDVRHYEKHLAFCIEIDYEVGEPQDPGQADLHQADQSLHQTAASLEPNQTTK